MDKIYGSELRPVVFTLSSIITEVTIASRIPNLIFALYVLMILGCTQKPQLKSQHRSADLNQTNQRFSQAGEEIRYGVDLRVSSQPLAYTQSLIALRNSPFSHSPFTKSGSSKETCGPNKRWFMGECAHIKQFYVWQSTSPSKHHHITTTSPHPCKQPVHDTCAKTHSSSARKGYIYSNQTFMALTSHEPSSAVSQHGYAVYALTSPHGYQYLTRSQVEKDNLTRYYGYKDSKILFYVASGKSFGNQKIYRYKQNSQTQSPQDDHNRGPWSYEVGDSASSAHFDGSLGWVLSSP